MNETPSSRLIAFCPCCNERLPFIHGQCSRCGVALKRRAADGSADTLLAHGWRKTGDGNDRRTAEFDDLPGSRLDVYQLESLIGSGGMGRVYLALHERLDRRCALKILSPRLAVVDQQFVDRFLNEGRAAAALVHPNIVTIHAIGQARGYHYLEMEFVAGRSLQQLLHDEGHLTPIRATALTAKIAEGLACAHRSNIVHRDLKPDNVLLCHRGIPKIADFGLAKRLVPDGGSTDLNRLAGTPNFMAPELFQGLPASPASDVYALGICYFLLLTGKFPFVASSLSELISAVATQPVPGVRDLCPHVPLEMGECVGLLLAKSLRNRPHDAVEAAQLLSAVLGQVRDIESLLKEAFRGDPEVKWTRHGRRYRIIMSLPDGRRQTLFVEPSEHGVSERLLLIFSTCCPAQPAFFETALRLNSEIPHGGLAIREIDGKPQFIVVDSYPRATVDVEEIRRSVIEVATRADAVEKLLTGRDQH